MKRIAVIGLAGVAVLAAGWSGLWAWGRGRALEEASRFEAEAGRRGWSVAWDGRDAGGYPFGIDITWRGLRVRAPDGTEIEAPLATLSVSAFDWSAVMTELPGLATLRLPPDATGARLVAELASLSAETRIGPGGMLTHAARAETVTLRGGPPEAPEALRAVAEAPVLDLTHPQDGSRADVRLRAGLASLATLAAGPSGPARLEASLTDLDLSMAAAIAAPAGWQRFAAGERDGTLTLRAGSLAAKAATPGPALLQGWTFDTAAFGTKLSIVAGAGSLALDAAAARFAVDLGEAPGTEPLAMQAGTLRASAALPLAKREAAEPLSLALDLAGVTATEAAWSVLLNDAGKVLPRDPAALAFDLRGKARWTVDPARLGAVPAAPGTRPFEVPELALTALRIAAAGAEVTATGTARMTGTEAGLLPEGRFEVAGTGLRELARRLGEIGAIASSEVSLFAAFSAAYAKPGPEPGSLVTEVVLGPEGVTVNGLLVRASQPAALPDAPLPPAPAPEPVPIPAAPLPPAAGEVPATP